MNNIKPIAATQEFFNSITPAMIDQVYSGKPGCMCGCNGTYWKTGRMVKKVLNILKQHPHAMVQDGYIIYIDYPQQCDLRNYVVYLKE
jgi:hypothetical protein